jgi:pimeloyl-ACP methyl ester carboxylesterase
MRVGMFWGAAHRLPLSSFVGGCGAKSSIFLALISATALQAQQPQQPKFSELPCFSYSVDSDSIAGTSVRCGYVRVPQDRANPKSKLRPVELPVVIYSSPTAKGTPVILLAGGPGESAIDATQRVLVQTPLGQMLLRERPIIAFDRRGIHTDVGRSVPDLGAILLIGAAPRRMVLPVLRDSLAAAAALMREQGIEPRNFTTLAASDDIGDVAHALGFDKVVLFGASYGTRDALQFMRRHPEMVEAAVLDGVAPPPATTLLDSATVAVAAMDVFRRVVADCAKDSVCANEYSDLGDVLRRFGPDSAKPVLRTANLPDDGGWKTLQVNPASVMSVLGLASTSETVRAELPAVMMDFALGDTLHSDLAAKVLVAAAADPAVSAPRSTTQLVRYAVLCGDRPQGEPFAGDRTLCDAFRVPFSGPDAIGQVTSDIPTLLISSGYDAQTPAHLAAEAAKTLSRSQQVFFPMAGHVAFARPVAMACAAVVIESFLMQPGHEPATRCVASVVPAFAPRGVTQQQSRPRR